MATSVSQTVQYLAKSRQLIVVTAPQANNRLELQTGKYSTMYYGDVPRWYAPWWKKQISCGFTIRLPSNVSFRQGTVSVALVLDRVGRADDLAYGLHRKYSNLIYELAGDLQVWMPAVSTVP